jgi:CheY-like chemotaxis protein
MSRQENAAHAVAVDPAALPRTRVLVLDDDREARTAMVRMLRWLGHEVTAVEDGRAALAQSPEEFDLIIADLNMPLMSGVDFKRELDERQVEVPVLIVSGEIDIAEIAPGLGAAAWIRKPCSATMLQDTLRSLGLPERTRNSEHSTLKPA